MNNNFNIFLMRIVPILALAIILIKFKNAEAVCSLDKMKYYAMEACDHLFQQDDNRNKRSLGYDNNSIMTYGHRKVHEKKHFISRSIYPKGGYLKVGTSHFNKLCNVDVEPRYKLKKVHHDKKERFKREHNLAYNNIVYCCFNACKSDFFC